MIKLFYDAEREDKLLEYYVQEINAKIQSDNLTDHFKIYSLIQDKELQNKVYLVIDGKQYSTRTCNNCFNFILYDCEKCSSLKCNSTKSSGNS